MKSLQVSSLKLLSYNVTINLYVLGSLQNLQLYVKLLGCHKIIQLVVDVECASP